MTPDPEPVRVSPEGQRDILLAAAMHHLARARTLIRLATEVRD